MNDTPYVIKLNDIQKRTILSIFIAAKKAGKDEEYIKHEIGIKLNSYMKAYTKKDLQIIYKDCKIAAFLDGMPPTYKKNGNDENSSISIGKEQLYNMAKDYIIANYKNSNTFRFDENGEIDDRYEIIEDLAQRLIKQSFKMKSENKTIEDIKRFLKSKKVDLKSLNSGEGSKKIAIMYIKSLISDLLTEPSKAETIKRMKALGESQEKINDYLKNYEIKAEIRRRVLVSDEEAKKFVESGDFKITLAEDYVYNRDGSRRIENSIVEEKLLSFYLETDRFDIFEETAHDLMYDKETGNFKPEQLRTASKYIKYLSRMQHKDDEAISFIKENIKDFKNDFVIMCQWFNIYRNRENHGREENQEGILEVSSTITECVKSKDNLYVVNEMNIDYSEPEKLKFLKILLYSTETISKNKNNKRNQEIAREQVKKLSVLIKTAEKEQGNKTTNKNSGLNER